MERGFERCSLSAALPTMTGTGTQRVSALKSLSEQHEVKALGRQIMSEFRHQDLIP